MTIQIRTPYRISLAGGSDDPAFVAAHGGFCLTTTLNRFVYIIAHRPYLRDDYLLKYSKTECARKIGSIEHPIIREALRFYDIPPGVEITSVADMPAGTGLGSSAAFTVGLCSALSRLIGLKLNRQTLAQHAAHVELDMAGRAGGAQDHYACALGGSQALTFHPDGSVDSEPMVADHLQKMVSIYFTGFSRNSDDILRSQAPDALGEVKELALASYAALTAHDLKAFGRLLNLQWELKRKRSPQTSNALIDAAHTAALENGAIGAKLVGAGGGGFIMTVAEDSGPITSALERMGLKRVPCKFDHMGTIPLRCKP